MNPTEDLLRECAPGVLAALVRRYGQFDAAEDAVQEAMLAAAQQWPAEGIPDSPRAWLITVAGRRLTDMFRSEAARRTRETVSGRVDPTLPSHAPPADEIEPAGDDTLTLLLLCCHPALTPASQVALTLRAVGGLTTEQIAAAFLVPESTMGQRISRAKATVRKAGARFVMPRPADLPDRLAAALRVLYLIFNEGYTATSGDDLQRPDLTAEAIRITRLARRLLPDDGEVAGLLALMLLTDARRPERVLADGSLVPLDEQDRTLWLRDMRDEGLALIADTLRTSTVGPYQVQAAIAAVHDEAATAADTDWPQIAALYAVLDRIAPGPMVTLNRAVAVAMVDGPRAGLDLLDTLDDDTRLTDHHRLAAVRAHLLEMAGEQTAAAAEYRTAAAQAASTPERRYLERRAERIASPPTAAPARRRGADVAR